MPQFVPWITEHPARSAALFLIAAFLILNVLAYRHAHAMTRFTPHAPPARGPEELTFFSRMRVLLAGIAIHRPQEEDSPREFGLAHEVHRFEGDAGTLEAWYIPHPQPRGLVVMFHGYLSCKARILPEARAFHELGYACFVVDFRGSGGSQGNRTTVGYFEADDVIRTVDYARARWSLGPLVVFGQSMGGAATLRALAVHGLQADTVILECPFDRLLTTVKARFAAMGVPWFPGAPLLVFWGGLLHGFNGFAHNPADYARRVACPVLLLHGQEDSRVRIADIRTIFGNLGGVKELHHLAGVGHESLVAKSPAEWKRHVERFLDLHERKALLS